jgi:hypothetical protein
VFLYAADIALLVTYIGDFKFEVQPAPSIQSKRMGIYLSTPKTDKISEDGENNEIRFGVSAMQGWRESMEDAVRILSAELYRYLLSVY